MNILNKKIEQKPIKYGEYGYDDKIEFNWTDVLAFIIAFFQVLYPYVLGTLASFTIVALILRFWMK